ncbi:MAG TPA: hypothetical protein ENH04_06030 [Nitrospirae bacterium]|nr:hypothetical protein [Nitrospirota bacterium]
MRAFPLLFIPGILSFKNSFDLRRILGRLPFILLGILFWIFIYVIFRRILVYFKSVELFGDILSAKLLSMIFLSFLSLLIMSNIITALSTFYLSRDLEFVLTKPVEIKKIHAAKSLETFVTSSWMVISFALPMLIAYGTVYGAGYTYYLALPVIFIPFLVIPTGIGITVTHVIARTLPARNARDVIMIIGIMFLLMIFLFFRFLQPEKLLNPESFPTLLEYLSNIGVDSAFMPYYWATHAILPLLKGKTGDSIFYMLVLISNGAFFMLIASWSGSRWYRAAIDKAFSAKKRGIRVPFEKLLPAAVSRLKLALLIKDLKIFLRDNSQWPQLLLLLALVVIYVYNFTVLPLDVLPQSTFVISNFIAFLNLILAGFVLSAIAARFLFPAVSIEGRALWVVKAAPLTMKDFLQSKLVSGLIPLVILSEILVVTTNLILQVDMLMMLVSLVTVFLMTLAIGGLGIGLGAVYPKFDYNNVASISMSFGGMLFMILALMSVTLTVLFEAWPLYLYLSAGMAGRPFGPWEITQTIISFSLVVVLNAVCFYVPLRIGVKSMETEKWT